MSPVTYSVQDRIAVITIDHAPVNALSHAVRAGLNDAIATFDADADAAIAVLVGAGRLFLGGADISEFGKPMREPLLPNVINTIEACPKPVVAAIHGNALGGGLEVALGAHYRLAMPGTKLGLPEVTLGILPGAGGTQRTPRLVGLEAAAEMITTGVPLSAQGALDAGLVDRMGEGDDVLAAARAYAADLLAQGAPARPTSAMPMPQGNLTDIRTAVAARTRSRPRSRRSSRARCTATSVKRFGEGSSLGCRALSLSVAVAAVLSWGSAAAGPPRRQRHH